MDRAFQMIEENDMWSKAAGELGYISRAIQTPGSRFEVDESVDCQNTELKIVQWTIQNVELIISN